MFEDRVFDMPRIPLGYFGPVCRTLACPRCGTPYALAGVATPGSFSHDARQLRQAAQDMLSRLHLRQPGAALPAFLLVRDRHAGAADELYQVWPAELAAVTPEQWIALRRSLLQQHRCVALATLWQAP